MLRSNRLLGWAPLGSGAVALVVALGPLSGAQETPPNLTGPLRCAPSIMQFEENIWPLEGVSTADEAAADYAKVALPALPPDAIQASSNQTQGVAELEGTSGGSTALFAYTDDSGALLANVGVTEVEPGQWAVTSARGCADLKGPSKGEG